MNDHTDTTLSTERTTQMRDLLTDEIRHDAAPSLTTSRQRRGTPAPRRVAVGAVAAVLVGGLLFGVNAVAGGPGQTAVPQALAIESSGGSTTIRLTDLDASPEEVLAQLEAAGIPVRLTTVDTSTPADDGTVELPIPSGGLARVPSEPLGNAAGLIGIMTESADGEWGQAVLPVAERADGPTMLSSFETIMIPECKDSVISDLPPSPECEAAMASPEGRRVDLRDKAIRMHEDGSVTVDDSSGTEILVLVRG